MKVSVITPSYNKPDYILRAIDSVVNQTHKDIEYYILENSTDMTVKEKIVDHVQDSRIYYTDEFFTDRKTQYPTTVLLNKYLPLLEGDIIMYLSDDDYFLPNCFEKVVNLFTSTPDAKVVYFGLSIQGPAGNEVSKIPANEKLPVGHNMDCMLDGGQVAFRRECLEKLPQPIYKTEMNNETAHCDGIFLNRLSKEYEFYNIPDILAVKQRTNISTFINF
jgi:spore maturation protein CgeD